MKSITLLLQIPLIILYALREVIAADTEIEIDQVQPTKRYRNGIFLFPHHQSFQ